MTDFLTMKKDAIKRFNELFDDEGEDTITLEYGRGAKYALFSDLHIGDGTPADNFRQNEKTFLDALEYYREGKFSIILLGDVEEFHQFSMLNISRRYFKKVYQKSVYSALTEFPEKKIFRVIGNHDIDWALEDPLAKKQKKVAVEAIKMTEKGSDKGPVEIMLTHGHQAEESYEKDLQTVRLGTTIFRSIEKLLRLSSSSILEEKPDGKDEIYDSWAAEKKIIFICGHTHHPIFGSQFIDYRWMKEKRQQIEDEIKALKGAGQQKTLDQLRQRDFWLKKRIDLIERKMLEWDVYQPPDRTKSKLSKYYFNTGAGMFNDAISNIEIDGSSLRLVYWFNNDSQRELLWENSIKSILA
jgi:UDP-2,3-diacylglucosamine pyrophosphatase LpxH